eukprot:TRINITY_DN9792_c0_g1_i1.p1 TRINITY_DN9792_c0_g1~~TRINITY_DN9792_c0_g1_i1.p1  ORF type:complete len:320 (-),score=90.58 TRINITY_DN9792_c0_g1_i1:46-1005(-)
MTSSEDEYSYSISEDDIQDITTISRVGYIQMKGKKHKFKAVYAILIGGSFYWFKNEKNSTEALGGIDLKDVEIGSEKIGNKNCFTLSNSDGIIFTGHVTSSTNLGTWTDVLRSNKEHCHPEPCPDREVMKKKKKNVVSGAVKNVVSKTATSSIGKKVMKAIINDETKSLIVALKRIVRSESGDEKKAAELENNIIKIAIKSFMLIDKGKLEAETFLKADAPLREAFELLGRCYTARNRVQPDVFRDALVRVEGHLRDAEEIITNILAPFLRPKNMFRISAAFGILADASFLDHVFQDPEIEPDLEKLIDAMEYYTQFHY